MDLRNMASLDEMAIEQSDLNDSPVGYRQIKTASRNMRLESSDESFFRRDMSSHMLQRSRNQRHP